MTPRVLAFGTFDELHPGHQFLLEEAFKRGELTVVVARDSNVRRIKGHPPLQSEDARRRAVQETVPQATVVLGDPEDFLRPVQRVQPDVIVLGYDQHLPPGIVPADLPCPIERIPAYHPEKYKSSLRRKGTASPS